jgi:hypothetical protein
MIGFLVLKSTVVAASYGFEELRSFEENGFTQTAKMTGKVF